MDPFIKKKYKMFKRLREKYPGCFMYLTFETDNRCVIYSKQNTITIGYTNLEDVLSNKPLSNMSPFLIKNFFDMVKDDNGYRFVAVDKVFHLRNGNQELWDVDDKYRIFNIHIDGNFGILPSLNSIILNVIQPDKPRLSSVQITDSISSVNMSTLMTYMSDI
jgi:hypothetical protein